ncbi:unnamed protein product, partial [Ceratitis capitata]
MSTVREADLIIETPPNELKLLLGNIKLKEEQPILSSDMSAHHIFWGNDVINDRGREKCRRN